MSDVGKEKGGKETTVLDRYNFIKSVGYFKKSCCQSGQFGGNTYLSLIFYISKQSNNFVRHLIIYFPELSFQDYDHKTYKSL